MAKTINLVPFETENGNDGVNVITNSGVILATITVNSNGFDWASIDISNLDQDSMVHILHWKNGVVDWSKYVENTVSIELRNDPL